MTVTLSPWVEKIIDRTIQMLQDDVLKKKIELHLLQPFMQHAIELVFPYVIIICAIFGLMILMMVSILGLLVFRLQPAVASAAGSSIV